MAERNRPQPQPQAPRDPTAQHTGRGPGRLLVAVYGLLALAATGRSVLQIIEYFDRAPLAYILSALAAVIYIVATVGLARGNRTSVRVAAVAVTIELIGVLVVGAVSYAAPELFPDKTVWSHFGQGYGYVPLVLPVLGLLWIRRHRGVVKP
jgi:cytochrome bd-type quinol oxidase subunit 2